MLIVLDLLTPPCSHYNWTKTQYMANFNLLEWFEALLLMNFDIDTWDSFQLRDDVQTFDLVDEREMNPMRELIGQICR